MSSFLEQDLSLTLSVTAESTTSDQTHSKKRSPVWKHYRRPILTKNQAILYCPYYKLDELPLLYGSTSSANILKYINRHHSEVVVKQALSKN